MPAPFRLATWNVNSIKMRGEQVVSWLAETQPDVLALQEIKVQTDLFPMSLFEEAGYHRIVYGQKTYNGVALLSKEPMDDVRLGHPLLPDDVEARVISAVWNGIRVLNVYVPNGQTVESEKYQYKLRWLDALARHLETECDPGQPMVIMGDFNIAPDERDIYDPEYFRTRVLFSELERAALTRFLNWGMVDVFRRFHEEDKLYSWWDYRIGAFRRNLGARIDLILATRPLAERAIACEIDVAPRRVKPPSDHTPVVVTFV